MYTLAIGIPIQVVLYRYTGNYTHCKPCGVLKVSTKIFAKTNIFAKKEILREKKISAIEQCSVVLLLHSALLLLHIVQ